MCSHLRPLGAFVLLVCLGVIAPACARVRPYYEIDFITIDRVEFGSPEHVGIEFHTLVESMYHAPGVDVFRVDEGLEVRVLRVFHEEPGDPDVVATPCRPGLLRVDVLLSGARKIVLADGVARRVIWEAPPTSSS